MKIIIIPHRFVQIVETMTVRSRVCNDHRNDVRACVHPACTGAMATACTAAAFGVTENMVQRV